MSYLLIAYKENSVDYCRGCRMASYSSDFVLENWLSRENLVKEWAKCLQINMNLSCNESGYSFYIFKEGVLLFEVSQVYVQLAHKYQWNDDDIYTEEFDSKELFLTNEITSIFEDAKILAASIQADQRDKEKRDLLAKRAAEAEEDKKRKLKQLEQLKKEFPDV